MKNVEVMINEEICKLEKIAKKAQERINRAPQGALRISKKNNGVQYYLRNVGSGKDNGKYIKKDDIGIAYELAQKDYDVRILKMAEERLCELKLFLRKYQQTDLGIIYRNTNSYRRELIGDAILPDDEFVKQWQSVEYEGKEFVDDSYEIITERGERVRSKSEKIIADKLYSLGIPYRYEYPLILQGNIKVYPDFTILKMPEREEVYLEHFGMMDDSSYADKALFKLSTYERNGIYIGVNLFVTYETSKSDVKYKSVGWPCKKIVLCRI